MSGTDIYSLNVHAQYGCRHSGACCTAGWSIPVEPPRRALIGTDWLTPDLDGACPQFDRGSRLCRVHRDHGEASLPDSCRHFPRRALVDGRGTFVTLSHFCPTAATLLLDTGGPLAVVAHPPAFPPDRSYDGLDARNEWPPLLRPDVLFDLESFTDWERFMVATLGAAGDTVDHTLRRIAHVAERLRSWTIARGPLRDWIARVLESPDEGNVGDVSPFSELIGSDAYRRVCATIPAGLTVPVLPAAADDADRRWVAPHWRGFEPDVLRYLATKAFGSWTPYQSRGIRTHVAELFLASAVVRVEAARVCLSAQAPLTRVLLREAVRMSDWLLLHLADREALMAWLGQAEVSRQVSHVT